MCPVACQKATGNWLASLLPLLANGECSDWFLRVKTIVSVGAIETEFLAVLDTDPVRTGYFPTLFTDVGTEHPCVLWLWNSRFFDLKHVFLSACVEILESFVFTHALR